MHTRAGERPNGTSRWRTQRQGRKTRAFAKATRYHRWRSWLAVGLSQVCHAPRSLKRQHEAPGFQQSPAMAAKLTDHSWSTWAWLLCPVLGC